MDPAMDVGRYRLGRLLAQSVMGEAYRAIEVALSGDERPVLLRILSREVSADPLGTRAMSREVGALYRSPQDNLVAVRELGRLPGDDRLFIATDWVDGPSLASLLARLSAVAGQPLPLRFGLVVAVEVTRGLEHLHALTDPSGAPLLACHGELDPSRVLLSRRGEVKIAGVGLGRLRSPAPGATSTPGSLSREQVRGEPPEPRSDLFALGTLLYQTLTGRHPFDADRVAPAEALARILAGRFIGARAHQPGLPESVESVLSRAMAPEVADRYASAVDLREDLEGLARREGYTLSLGHLGAFVEQVMEKGVERVVSPAAPLAAPRRSGPHILESQKSFDAALREQLASLHHDKETEALAAPATVATPRLSAAASPSPDKSGPITDDEIEVVAVPGGRRWPKLVAGAAIAGVSMILGARLRLGRPHDGVAPARVTADVSAVAAGAAPSRKPEAARPEAPARPETPATAEPNPKAARLSVSSDVVANVFVDGVFVHTTPVTNLKVAPGRHVVRLEGDGGGLRLIPREQMVLLRPGEARHLAMALR
jgi:serine/threonine protein kinase